MHIDWSILKKRHFLYCYTFVGCTLRSHHTTDKCTLPHANKKNPNSIWKIHSCREYEQWAMKAHANRIEVNAKKGMEKNRATHPTWAEIKQRKTRRHDSIKRREHGKNETISGAFFCTPLLLLLLKETVGNERIIRRWALYFFHKPFANAVKWIRSYEISTVKLIFVCEVSVIFAKFLWVNFA